MILVSCSESDPFYGRWETEIDGETLTYEFKSGGIFLMTIGTDKSTGEFGHEEQKPGEGFLVITVNGEKKELAYEITDNNKLRLINEFGESITFSRK